MTSMPRMTYPFVAMVGQRDMKRALVLNVVDPRVGGVMIMGRRGTGKSTAVRALAELMPAIRVVSGCPMNCTVEAPAGLCRVCTGVPPGRPSVSAVDVAVPVIDLPLGATEDSVTGTLDIEAALIEGRRSFEPGLLARAHRGFLYVDEANLLEDHLVDLLLDVAAAGENIVERESISARHPSRFVLVGSGNPEEGRLRPQLLDRFGLFVDVVTETAVVDRVDIVRRRLAFDDDPEAFRARYQADTDALKSRLEAARGALGDVTIDDDLVAKVAEVARRLDIDGHRGELVCVRAARAHAALRGGGRVEAGDLGAVAVMALRHRLHRDPLDDSPAEHRVEDALDAVVPTWREIGHAVPI